MLRVGDRVRLVDYDESLSRYTSCCNNFISVIMRRRFGTEVTISRVYEEPRRNGCVWFEIEEGCFNVMQEVAKENPDEQGFIKDIVENWKKIKNEEDILIKPSEVFGVGPTRDNRK